MPKPPPAQTDPRRAPLPPGLPAAVRDLGAAHLRGLIGPRNAAILARYYGLGQPRETLQAIGDDYGISRERVRQIVQRGLYHLRVEATS